jgi:hypothetical protein
VEILFLFLFALTCCVVSTVVGQAKGRGVTGFLFGLSLGPIGLIITALLPATERKEAERRAALAEAISRNVSSYPTSPQTIRTPDERREAMARAIEKDPSLGASDDPETLERLRQATDQILLDLETLRARQAIVDEKAAAEAETARLEAARVASVELAAKRAEQEAKRAEQQDRASQDRASQLAAMNPVARFARVHQRIIGIVLVSSLLVSLAGLGIWRVRVDDAEYASQLAATAQRAADAARRAADAKLTEEAEANEKLDRAVTKYESCLNSYYNEPRGSRPIGNFQGDKKWSAKNAKSVEKLKNCLLNYSGWPSDAGYSLATYTDSLAAEASFWRQMGRARSNDELAEIFNSNYIPFSPDVDPQCALQRDLGNTSFGGGCG